LCQEVVPSGVIGHRNDSNGSALIHDVKMAL
jgi:hypothetical protein